MRLTVFSDRKKLFFLLTFFVILLIPGWAQQTTGNVRGFILDQTGAVVAQAKVMIFNPRTNTSLSTISTGAGEYEFKNLPTGEYKLTIEAPGFKTMALNEVRVQLNQTTDVPASLTVGGSNEKMEIIASGAGLVDTATTNNTKGFNERQVVELAQTATGAGLYNLALIAPNVTSSGGVGVGTGGAVGGQRPRNNNFVVDGIDNNDKAVTGPQVYISPESVAEFSLLSNQYQAEFAHSTGGQFITVTRSGTNEVRGTAYGFFRNRHLNALDTLQKNAGVTRCYDLGNDNCNPRYDNGRYGFNIGGPLIFPRFGEGGPSIWNGKSKLFFFTGYERTQTGSAAGAGGVTTPTAAGMAVLSTIPGLSATNLAIFKQYVPVAPAQMGGTITVNGVRVPVGYVNIPAPNYNFNHYFVLNLDYTQNEHTQHRARFNFNQNRAIDTAASLPTFFQLIPTDSRLFSYTLTHSFTTQLSNETRVAYRRYANILSAGNFHFPGLDQFPNIGLIELNLNLGPDGNAPQFGIENNYQIVNNLSYLAGNHSLKFGVDARKLISPQSFVQRQRGDYQYVSTDLFLRDISPDFLAERSVGASAYYGDQILLFTFAQDDWRVRQNLTLNLGVNYSYQELPRGARGQVVNKLSSVPGLLTFDEPKPQLKNFAPRIGFAYSPNYSSGMLGRLFGSSGKTSIRAGFSMAYDVIFDNLYILSLPPQSNQTVDVDTGIPNFSKMAAFRPRRLPSARTPPLPAPPHRRGSRIKRCRIR
ncbi:MAG: carboxypeptidase regulatory-like domain-containing protein [Blastocatellia bacterium]